MNLLGKRRSRRTRRLARSGIRDAYVEMIVTRGLKFVRQAKPGDELTEAYWGLHYDSKLSFEVDYRDPVAATA